MRKPTDRDVQLQQLLDRHGDHLLRICMVYVKERQYAQDAVQETLIKAYQSPKTIRITDPRQQRAWLTRIAINTCKDMLRKRDFTYETVDLSSDTQYSSPSPPEYDLLSVIQTLPVPQREALILYYYQELSMEEIAKLLHIAKATVHYRLNQAKQALRIQLEGSDEDE